MERKHYTFMERMLEEYEYDIYIYLTDPELISTDYIYELLKYRKHVYESKTIDDYRSNLRDCLFFIMNEKHTFNPETDSFERFDTLEYIDIIVDHIIDTHDGFNKRYFLKNVPVDPSGISEIREYLNSNGEINKHTIIEGMLNKDHDIPNKPLKNDYLYFIECMRVAGTVSDYRDKIIDFIDLMIEEYNVTDITTDDIYFYVLLHYTHEQFQKRYISNTLNVQSYVYDASHLTEDQEEFRWIVERYENEVRYDFYYNIAALLNQIRGKEWRTWLKLGKSKRQEVYNCIETYKERIASTPSEKELIDAYTDLFMGIFYNMYTYEDYMAKIPYFDLWNFINKNHYNHAFKWCIRSIFDEHFNGMLHFTNDLIEPPEGSDLKSYNRLLVHCKNNDPCDRIRDSKTITPIFGNNNNDDNSGVVSDEDVKSMVEKMCKKDYREDVETELDWFIDMLFDDYTIKFEQYEESIQDELTLAIYGVDTSTDIESYKETMMSFIKLLIKYDDTRTDDGSIDEHIKDYVDKKCGVNAYKKRFIHPNVRHPSQIDIHKAMQNTHFEKSSVVTYNIKNTMDKLSESTLSKIASETNNEDIIYNHKSEKFETISPDKESVVTKDRPSNKKDGFKFDFDTQSKNESLIPTPADVLANMAQLAASVLPKEKDKIQLNILSKEGLCTSSISINGCLLTDEINITIRRNKDGLYFIKDIINKENNND